MKLRTRSADETRALGGVIAPLLQPGDVLVLEGELGAGKTTFAQGLARGVGVVDPVLSPTFALVNEYDGPLPVAHVDVYRLDRLQEVHDLGFDELVDDGRVTVIEWGDRITQVLPTDRLVVRFEYADDPDARDERDVHVQPLGSSWARRADRLGSLVADFATEHGSDEGSG